MKKLQIFFTFVFSAVFSWLGVLAIPVFLLLGCNIADYATGLASAKYRDPESKRPISSYKSIRGIFKKVGMYILILIGGAVDLLINYGLASIPNTTLQLPYIVATIIATWLVFNECLSILENLDDIGTPIPPFLKPLLKMMKKTTEKTFEEKEEEEG